MTVCRHISKARDRLRRLCTIKIVRRLGGDEQGAAAVEFAIVVVPFLMILFAIMETAIVFFAGQTLETAAADSARLIMTGQAQTGSYDQTAFKNAVCARVFGLFNCQSGIYVDVKNYSTFGGVSLSAPLDANGNFQSNNFSYAPGGPNCITVVRLFYQWPIYLSFMGFNLSNMAGNKRLLSATVAFRNEPYATANACS